ncbi:hypothetical protein ACFQL7_20805 [Halocatena marina]|uniref:Uncharacterized protein n=1 Tax=Halocatena marina TaxID=2934937 RepID=A0ABD5YSF2_9EURY|nr:hypothetical protein [Halocatena marina]
MTSYSTNLKSWGDAGSEYPNGYSYLEGEQPVDAWDNFFNANVINDLNHLINLTNSRLDSGTGASRPSSPTNGEEFYDTDTGVLEYYDNVGASWRTLATRDWVLNSSGINDADFLDGFDSSEFAILAQNETVTGSYTFDQPTTFNSSIDIYAAQGHIDYFESDNTDKNWRTEVQNGTFRVYEMGVDEQLAIDPGGLVRHPNGASFGADVNMNGNQFSDVHSVQSGDTLARLNLNAGAADIALQTGGQGGGAASIYDNYNSQDIAQFSEGGNVYIPNGNLETQNGWVTTSGSSRRIHVSDTDPGGSNDDIWLKPN